MEPSAQQVSTDRRINPYAVAAVAVTAAWGAKVALEASIGSPSPYLLFSGAVMIGAWFGGLGPGLFATLASSLLAQFFIAGPGVTPGRLIQTGVFVMEGAVISMLGRAHTITRRASLEIQGDFSRQEHAFKNMEARFSLFIAGVKEYAIIMLDAEGYVVSWNDGAERMMGYRERDILRRHYGLFFPSEECERGEPTAALACAVQKGRFEAEGWRVRKDGARFWADVLIRPLQDEAGRLPGFAMITRDVTDRKTALDTERELRAALRAHADELERRVAQRTKALQEANEELEMFAYSISHDLRAPLRAMQGFGDALVAEYADRLDETGADYARRIMGAAHRMDRLIQDLLAYGRLGRPDVPLAPVNAETALREGRRQQEEEIAARHAVITVEEPFPAVMGHGPTLAQVFANLLANAITFVAPSVTPHVVIRAERRDEWVRFWVEDNGIGIAPEHHERIFRVFERLHGVDQYSGTGIGLAIVAKGAARMKGRAGVISQEGQGSRFWIDLRAGDDGPPMEDAAHE